MTIQDAETIIALAALAATADGNQNEAERASVAAAAARLGLPDADNLARRAPGDEAVDVATLAARLSDDDARRSAYETAAAVCHADGEPNAGEVAFLSDLARHLGTTVDTTATAAAVSAVAQVTPAVAATPPAVGDLSNFILDQAMLTAACDLLPDNLANMAILPLQLRMVYSIGQHHGQKLDISQVKDLAGALGIGAAAQVMESVVRKTLGGLTGGLLGGLFGGAAGMAAGAAVTFAATYALGHAAEQYYVQGRQMSSADLKALFTRFQGEANQIFPRVEQRIRTLSSGQNLSSILRGLPT